jgi:FkbM family methyltransferase
VLIVAETRLHLTLGSQMATLIGKVLSPHNWRGFNGLLRTAVDPVAVIRRYYLRQGSYPYIVRLRTPIGVTGLEMQSRDDFITVHEIFFREDYRLSKAQAQRLRVAVDFGTNIGVASAYFLTRNAEARVYSYEPVPRNIERARKNLAPFAARLEFNECAVGVEEGDVSFGVEGSGRYGGIGVSHAAQITVPCRRGESELQRILRQHPRIDALKLDIEGMEVPIIKSLPPEMLDVIGCIVAECDGREVSLPNFSYGQYLSIARFTAISGQGSP